MEDSVLRIVITEHARKRLKGFRQRGVNTLDIIECASTIPGKIPTATRFRGFFAKSGRVFDLVVKDISTGRLVITVIGK